MALETCPTELQLNRFHLGDLPEPERSEVARHLESCIHCEMLARQLNATQKALPSSPSPIPTVAAPKHQATQTLVFDSEQALRYGSGANASAFPFLQPPLQPDEIGRLGQFRILELLGQGGMGYVFRGEDALLQRPVAIKVMKPQSASTEEWKQRFLMEARILAKLRHEHLVTIFHVGLDGGACYLVMELLKGEALDTWLNRLGPPSPGVLLRLACEITAGLDAVHRHSLVHRDVKPANIWLEAPDDRVKLIDFGLARFVHDDIHLTRSGMIVGTPAFMSPEQARGEPVDARSDLFSLGSVLYYLASATIPFRGTSTTAILLALAGDKPQNVRELNPAVPRPLADLIGQLMTKEPAKRPDSAYDVLQQLRRIQSETPVEILGKTSELFVPGAGRRREKSLPVNTQRNRLLLLAGILLVAGIGLYGRFGMPKSHIETQIPDVEVPVYLSDMKPVATVNWPFVPPPEKKKGPANFFDVISVDGKISQHGIGMHPVHQGPSSVTYALDGKYRAFRADVSLNDSSKGAMSPMTFRVYGDGRILWQSGPVVTSSDAQACTVPVSGVNHLQLEVSVRDIANGAHGVWLEPRVAE